MSFLRLGFILVIAVSLVSAVSFAIETKDSLTLQDLGKQMGELVEKLNPQESQDPNHSLIVAQSEKHADYLVLVGCSTGIEIAPGGVLSSNSRCISLSPREFTLPEVKALAKGIDDRVKASKPKKRVWFPTKARVLRAQELMRAYFKLQMRQALLRDLIASMEQFQKKTPKIDGKIAALQIQVNGSERIRSEILWASSSRDLIETFEELPNPKDPDYVIDPKQTLGCVPIGILQLAPSDH